MPFSLRGMRAKVWKGRTESPLFNCQTYAHDLERLFKLMWDKHAVGDAPDHITGLTHNPELHHHHHGIVENGVE